VRWGASTIIGLSVLVPAALIVYGDYENGPSASSVGGPLTEMLCIVAGVVFDLLLWLSFALFLILRSARRAAHDLRDSARRAA
jgi:hypothetical protein